MEMTTNNTKVLRLALLLTPQQLADRLGVTTKRVQELEQSGSVLPEGWPEALAHALGVPTPAITDPDTDIEQTVRLAKNTQAGKHRICRIAARFALLSMVAKLGGLNIALELSEADLEIALQSLILYTEDFENQESEKERLNRLSQSLQITALAILQSHGVESEVDLLHEMEIARDGALSLIEAFSRADRLRLAWEMK